jgi:hypothetical protein
MSSRSQEVCEQQYHSNIQAQVWKATVGKTEARMPLYLIKHYTIKMHWGEQTELWRIKK